MAVYLLNSGLEAARAASFETRIRAAIPDLVKLAAIDDLADRLARETSDPGCVLLLAPLRDHGRFERTIDIVSRFGGRAFFIVVGDEISATDYKALVRLRNADWVSAEADPQEVLDMVARTRRAADLQGGAPSGARAAAITFAASAGGVGNTTLAVEAAVLLKTEKATRHRNVCIVDLDFQGSHVCDHLDIEPRLQIQEISANPDRLDAQLFEIFVSRHASGVHVIAAPRTRFDYCDLNVASLDRLLDMAAARYDLILIDLPATWFAWTPQIIAASDGVIVTGLNTIPSLRRTAETLAAIRQSGSAPGRVAAAINRCQRALIGGIARRQHVRSVLGGETVFYVAEEPALLQRVNIGAPAMTTNASRTLRKQIGLLARFCAEVRQPGAATARASK